MTSFFAVYRTMNVQNGGGENALIGAHIGYRMVKVSGNL
jgi:hypothetical protein